jgi:hypothetical protein
MQYGIILDDLQAFWEEEALWLSM